MRSLLPQVSVFCRTTPEHKFRLVKMLQDMGEVVLVTGDGVNDGKRPIRRRDRDRDREKESESEREVEGEEEKTWGRG